MKERKEKMMSNSPLVSYTKLSPNNSGARTHTIDRITPHCVVGQCSVETLGSIFSKSSAQASSNYGIGADGRVGMYVEESKRSWCSSSNANDQRAVTIECASDATAPYAFKDAVFNKLIDLCVDICERNGKKKLLWISDKTTALNYSPKSDEMVLTVHRWFANKSCPGDWLMARMDKLAKSVTDKLLGLQYRAYVQGIGYMDWASNGEVSGTTGQGKRMEAIQFSKDSQITATCHCQNYGDMNPVLPANICGTVGESLRMESIKLEAPYKIEYRVHQQGIGWTSYVSNGTWCGVKGQSKRIEAIQVRRV